MQAFVNGHVTSLNFRKQLAISWKRC